MSSSKSEKPAIQEKIVIVTGGTRGIGRAIVESLLDEGAKVAFCGATANSVEAATLQLSGRGDVFGMVADVSDFEQVKRFIDSVAQKFHTVDVLINNAGAGIFRPTLELTPPEWNRMISINLSGAYYCSHQVLPIFKQRGGGDIINVSSLAGKNPFAGGAGYNASKFGLNGFSEAMMLDHRNDGVRVSYIMPGSVATEFGGETADTGADWKIAPEDIADVVIALLRMPRRTTVSRVEIRPSQPGKQKR